MVVGVAQAAGGRALLLLLMLFKGWGRPWLNGDQPKDSHAARGPQTCARACAALAPPTAGPHCKGHPPPMISGNEILEEHVAGNAGGESIQQGGLQARQRASSAGRRALAAANQTHCHLQCRKLAARNAANWLRLYFTFQLRMPPALQPQLHQTYTAGHSASERRDRDTRQARMRAF